MTKFFCLSVIFLLMFINCKDPINKTAHLQVSNEVRTILLPGEKLISFVEWNGIYITSFGRLLESGSSRSGKSAIYCKYIIANRKDFIWAGASSAMCSNGDVYKWDGNSIDCYWGLDARGASICKSQTLEADTMIYNNTDTIPCNDYR